MFNRPARVAFEGQVGEEIRVRFDDGSALALRIAEVQDLGTRKTEQGTLEAYSVSFHGPVTPSCPWAPTCSPTTPSASS